MELRVSLLRIRILVGVGGADSSGNNAAFAVREQYRRMPIRMPHATANRNPTVPSNNVTCVAGQSVGQVSTVACAISLGAAIIVLGTWPSRTQASQITSSNTIAAIVGTRLVQIVMKRCSAVMMTESEVAGAVAEALFPAEGMC